MKPDDLINDPDNSWNAAVVRRNAIRAQAQAEFEQEQFRDAVEAEKARIRARQQSWWTRLIKRLFK